MNNNIENQKRTICLIETDKNTPSPMRSPELEARISRWWKNYTCNQCLIETDKNTPSPIWSPELEARMSRWWKNTPQTLSGEKFAPPNKN
jgi:hypothetical protein